MFLTTTAVSGNGDGQVSPLPFGIHRVPDREFHLSKAVVMLSPLPFGIHRVPDATQPTVTQSVQGRLHCLSAFTVFLTGNERGPVDHKVRRLHCLSAFTVFLTR